jgi:hypothetical protein
MKIRPDFDWKTGLVALGFIVAAIVGAGWLKDPAGRAACVGLLVACGTAVPSWLFHRTEGDGT